MQFLESGHKFTVARANVQNLEFGNRRFFTTLANGLPIDLMEQTVLASGSLFQRGLVFPALSFHAECVVLLPTGTVPADIQLRSQYDFGFVQGLRTADIHLEYWGQVPSNGRTNIHITMPNAFEIDTEASIKPFTVAPSAPRFEIINISVPGSGSSALRVSSDFVDHPLYTFPHTLEHMLHGTMPVSHFLRWVFFRREFRTVFCYRNKSDGSFTPISCTAWMIDYNHKVSYVQGAPKPTVETSTSAAIPTGPTQIDETVRRLMTMAKANAPLLTPQLLQERLSSAALRTVTEEDTNPDFISTFWR
jgi:hypothetical protein